MLKLTGLIPWNAHLLGSAADWFTICLQFQKKTQILDHLTYIYKEELIFFTAQIMSFKAIFTWPFIVEISTPKPKSPCVQSQVAQF